MNFKPNPIDPTPENLSPQAPVQLFDDLYFVGNKMVGSWVITTSEGLVLIEAGADEDHWEACLKPGLEELGLADRKVLALLLTHGHFDHYAGCDHIRRATGCDVCLSAADTIYMSTGVENHKSFFEENLPVPQVNRIIKPGDDLVFGDHTISVLDGAGHTPGCLNYSMEVHDGKDVHRFVMMGGYGIFGPDNFMGEEYPYGPAFAFRQAVTFAACCVDTWEYAKKNHCDVFFNPHPHLCNMHELAALNRNRKPGDPNAFVIGEDGVRQWLLERYEACMQMCEQFTDIRKKWNA